VPDEPTAGPAAAHFETYHQPTGSFTNRRRIMTTTDRREFLRRAAAVGGAGLIGGLVPTATRAAVEGRRVRVAVVGLGRGLEILRSLLQFPSVEVTWLADVDPQRLAMGMQLALDGAATAPRGVQDFRQALDDDALDAVFVATPNFWQTPASLLALQAGKHVYVEKPGSQNPREAEMIVAAAARYDRLVQMGNQRRTWMRDSIAALHGGAIGTVRYARATYVNARPPGPPQPRPPAPGTNLDLWQGPVPDDPRHDLATLVHYAWHWFWHWGNGELGNNGIHFLDVMRWGLKAEHPRSVTYTGGRYWWTDPIETPDTATAVYDFGHAGCEWSHSSCHPRRAEKPLGDVVFTGDGGTMAVKRDSWTIYDLQGRETGRGTNSVANAGDLAHIGNFIAAIRGEAELTSPIAEAQKSTMLCHLGNIAYRTGTVVRCDPQTGKVLDNPAAEKLWGRPAYRPGWDVRV
jgi:predicted dehydrogenase